MTPQPLSIIIPTRNRIEKLRRAIASIREGEAGPAGSEIVIVCDGDPATAAEMARDKRVARVILNRQHRGSVFSRNLATATTEGPLIYATDDLEFLPGSIASAMKTMAESFPDGDGVVGFYQGATPHSPTGVALVGQTFLRRYPGRRLFYPGYFHFSCQEIESASASLGKLAKDPGAEIRHYHPRRDPAGLDETHNEARIHRARDLELSMDRRKRNAIWGLTDFEEPK